MKGKKWIFAMILALIVSLMLVPAAFAEGEDPSGDNTGSGTSAPVSDNSTQGVDSVSIGTEGTNDGTGGTNDGTGGTNDGTGGTDDGTGGTNDGTGGTNDGTEGTNDGTGNGGDTNEGDANEGDSNEGDSNEGDSNEGDSNEGDSNEGDSNEGDSNEGDSNEGDSNEGDSNEGGAPAGEGQSAPPYTVEFTLGENQYVMDGNTTVEMTEILGALGIQGEVADAVGTADSLFAPAKGEDGKWTVSANNAFKSTQGMTVTMADGTVYDIIVTDDGTVCVKDGSNETKTYNSISEAITGGTTHIVLTDHVTENVVIAEGKTITIDLNGFTITNNGGHTIVNRGNLTIVDNSEEKTGKVDNVTHGKAALVNYGTAVLNGGTFTRSKEDNGNSPDSPGKNSFYTIQNMNGAEMTINDGVEVYNAGHYSSMICNGDADGGVAKLTINGGTFSGGINTVKNGTNGELIIKDGDFSNTSQFVIMNWHKADISGGSFKTAIGSTKAVVFTSSYGGDPLNVGTLTITDGEFESHNNAPIIDNIYNDENKGMADVSGGSFNKSISVEFCADDFKVVDNGDGTFDVKANNIIWVEDKSGNVEAKFETLQAFRDSVNNGNSYQNKVVKLMGNVDLNNKEWTPIGTSSKKFQGVFDGGNHTISNLLITDGKNYIGLFGYTQGGEIKNLTVHNAKVSGQRNVGVVAGYAYTSKYSNIRVTGHVEVNGMANVGGVGGYVYTDWTDITVDVDDTSYVNAVSTDTNGREYYTYVGGVVGFMGDGNHGLTNVSCNIDVIGNVCGVGGIMGIAHRNNKFEDVSYSGTVTNTHAEAEYAVGTGLLAGVWHNSYGTVSFTNCSSTGTVLTPNADVTLVNGGLIGPAFKPNDTNWTGKLLLNGVETLQVVAVVNGTPYGTLADAIDAAQNRDTIVLAENITLEDGVTIPKDKTITIDLNGKTLDSDSFDPVIINNGTLTLTNSAVYGSASIIENNGTLTVNNGNVGNLLNNGNAAIHDGSVMTLEGTSDKLSISGGCFGFDPSEFVDDDAVVTKLGAKFDGGYVWDNYAVNESIPMFGDFMGVVDEADEGTAAFTILKAPEDGAEINIENFHKDLWIVNDTDAEIILNGHVIPAGGEGYLSDFPVRGSGAFYVPVSAKYFVIEGADQEWTKGSEKGVEIRLNSNKVVKVLIDGEEVEFTVEEDGTVTIAAEILNALEAGEHEITFIFADGQCSTSVFVLA